MFSLIRNFRRNIHYKIEDVSTINSLFKKAEDYAAENGEEKPGAEHFLLAAMTLPDGTAKGVFSRVGADPEAFLNAINEQYRDALRSVGIEVDQELFDEEADPALSGQRKIYTAKSSVGDLMKSLVKLKSKKNMPLLGAHVIEVLAATEHGVAARAFQRLGIDMESLKAAALEEIQAYAVKLN